MNAWRILRQRAGFTLVELMITMVIFVFAMAAATGMFSGLLTQFKQQSRIAESGVESSVGLELLRRDLQQAGNGIPWNLNSLNYTEVPGGAAGSAYNDDNGGVSSYAPRALVIGDTTGWKSQGQGVGSDEIAIKATSVATNETCQKWTFIAKKQPGPNVMRTWGAIARENLDVDHDYVIVINPGSGNVQRTLLNDAGTFFVKLNNSNFSFNKTAPANATTSYAFEPFTDTQGAYVVYGVKSDEDGVVPRMPFNRADYYIDSPVNIPSRCAGSGETDLTKRKTGVLYKSMISHSDGKRGPGLPILDCVADMQVVAKADTSVPPDGTIDTDWETVPGPSTTAAQDIGTQMKEVRVYILAQEGQKDPSYQFTNFTGSPAAPFSNTCAGSCATCVLVGESPGPGVCSGHIFDLSKIPDYLNYRWKVYTITAATNLR